jgi:uncharacterized membrane protein
MRLILILAGLFLLVKIAEKRMLAVLGKKQGRKAAFGLWLVYTAFGLYLLFKGRGVL